MASRRKRFYQGVFGQWTQNALQFVTGLWVTPIFLAFLGPELLGLHVFVSSIGRMADLSNMGIQQGLSSLVAKQAKLNMDNQLAKDVTSAVQIQFFLCILIIIGSGLVAWKIGFIAEGLRPEWIPMARWFTLLAGFCIALQKFSEPYQGILEGFQLMGLNSLYKSFAILIRVAFSLLFLSLGFSLYSLAFGMLISILFMFGQMVFRVRKIGWNWTWVSFGDLRKSLRTIWNVSGWIYLGSLGGLVVQQTGKVLLGSNPEYGLATVNAFAFLTTVPFMALIQANKISSLFRPGLTQMLHQESTFGKAQDLIIVLQKMAWLFAAMGFVGVLFLNGPFISLWVGPSFFLGNSANLALAAYLAVRIITFPLNITLHAAFQFKAYGIISSLKGLLVLVGSLVFIPSFGVEGLLWVLFCAECIFEWPIKLAVVIRHFSWGWKSILTQFSMIIPMSILLLVFFYVLPLFTINSYLTIISLSFLIIGFIGLIGFLWIRKDISLYLPNQLAFLKSRSRLR